MLYQHHGIIRQNNASELSIKLINGSVITFHSAAQKEALRGYTVTGILCVDECAFISDDVFNLVRPWVDVWKAPMLLVSTPFTRNGFFYQNYNMGLQNIPGYITIDWQSEEYQEDMSKILSPQKLLCYKEVMPANQFKSEYLGDWLDDGRNGFPRIQRNSHK